jgi:hypothetical protein
LNELDVKTGIVFFRVIPGKPAGRAGITRTQTAHIPVRHLFFPCIQPKCLLDAGIFAGLVLRNGDSLFFLFFAWRKGGCGGIFAAGKRFTNFLYSSVSLMRPMGDPAYFCLESKGADRGKGNVGLCLKTD